MFCVYVVLSVRCRVTFGKALGVVGDSCAEHLITLEKISYVSCCELWGDNLSEVVESAEDEWEAKH